VALLDERGVTAAVDRLGLPLMMKAPHEGSTLGIFKATHKEDALGAYRHAAQYDDVVLAEQFISGRELTVAILGGGESARALPLIEIVAPDGNYDYQHKYFSDDTRYLCPAPVDPALAAHIAQMSVQAYRALGCEGWGRADVMLDAAGKAWLIEMNTSPGMTGHSLVPMAAKAVGLDYPSLCMHILSEARCKVSRLKQE
jgi:D-alanine-D-alanine ligase